MSTTEAAKILEDRRVDAEHRAGIGRLSNGSPPTLDFADERVRQARQAFDERMHDVELLLEQADAVALLIIEAAGDRSISNAMRAIIALLGSTQDMVSAASLASQKLEAALTKINAVNAKE